MSVDLGGQKVVATRIVHSPGSPVPGLELSGMPLNLAIRDDSLPIGGGAPGPQGEKGDRGDPGPAGAAGPQGIQGEPGIPGPQGPIGPQGDQGVQGPAGEPGVGITYRDNVASYEELLTITDAQPGDAYLNDGDGKLYIYGESGWPPEGDGGQFQGPQGVQGIQGPVGPQGEPGQPGTPGVQGEQGIQGPIGLTGSQGPQGIRGAGFFEWHPDPEMNMDNISQVPGMKVGDYIYSTYSPVVILGYNCLHGDIVCAITETDGEWAGNMVGPIGPMGPVGPQGPQGASVTPDVTVQEYSDLAAIADPPFGHVALVLQDGLIYIYGQNGWPAYGEGIQIKGDKGDMGPEGPQGPIGGQGPKGDQGIPGVNGLQGPIGPQGIQGEQGAPGIDGTPGTQGPKGDPGTGINMLGQLNSYEDLQTIENPQIGDSYLIGGLVYIYSETGWPSDGSGANIQGPAGPQGPQGDTGAQGLQGVQGPVGPAGPEGPQGIQGVMGVRGSEGPQGLQGVPGDVGPQGPRGSQGGRGEDGLRGPQGLQGPIGPQGERGEAGLGFKLIGNVPTYADLPSSNVAAGDAYIVDGPEGSPNGRVYIYTDNGWPPEEEGARIVGPQGPQGIPGEQGPQGDPGNDGPPGDQGPQGDQGPRGLQGIPGTTGPQGPPGVAGVSQYNYATYQQLVITPNSGTAVTYTTPRAGSTSGDFTAGVLTVNSIVLTGI